MAQKTVPTLYHLTSSQSLPVLMALEEASALRPGGLKYNLDITQRKDVARLKQFHPLGKSPTMLLEPADGHGEKKTLIESRYILQYISDNYTNGEWVPTTAAEKERDAFYQEFAKSTLLMKVDFVIIYDAPTEFLPIGLKQIAKVLVSPMINHFKGDLRDIYQLLEDALSDEWPWLSGSKFGLADFNAIFAMDMAVQRNYGWDAAKYPKLAKWHRHVLSRDSYKRALEKGGAYRFDKFS